MKNKDEANNWVNDVMNSIEGISKVQANHFLFEKIQYRVTQPVSEKKYIRQFYTMAVMLLALLVVNVFTYSIIAGSKNEMQNSSIGIEAFATEYNLQPTGNNL